MNATPAVQALLGLAVGLGCTAVHLALLQRQLNRLWTLQTKRTSGHLLAGLPVRLLLWAPAVAFTLWVGAAACIALFAALVFGRWALLAIYMARQSGQSGSAGRGC